MKACSNGLKTKINVSIQSLIKDTKSDCTGGHEVMQFDTASQNKYDVQPLYIDR